MEAVEETSTDAPAQTAPPEVRQLMLELQRRDPGDPMAVGEVVVGGSEVLGRHVFVQTPEGRIDFSVTGPLEEVSVVGAPSGRRTAMPRLWIQRHDPSLWRSRSSTA